MNKNEILNRQISDSLTYACIKGERELFDYLIEKGADITINDNKSLIAACKNGHIEIAKILIEKGADVTSKDNCALEVAAENMHSDIVELLLDKGASVPQEDYRYNNMMRKIVENNDLKTLKLIVKQKIDVSFHNNSLIIFACEKGYADIVEELIRLGSDVNARDGEPLVAAVESKSIETVKVLLNAGANVNLRKKKALKKTKYIDKDMYKLIKGYTKLRKLFKIKKEDIT